MPTTTASPTTFPACEPMAYNDHMRRYKLEFLMTENPVERLSVRLSGPFW
jgi:hypothetical protein